MSGENASYGMTIFQCLMQKSIWTPELPINFAQYADF